MKSKNTNSDKGKIITSATTENFIKYTLEKTQDEVNGYAGVYVCVIHCYININTLG